MQSSEPINIIIADDHLYFRRGLQFTLSKNPNFKFVAEAAHGKELCEQVKTHRPHVIITDISMPIMNGIEATRILKNSYANLGVVALSMYEEVSIIKEMYRAGANAYLPKSADTTELMAAIYTASSGAFFASTVVPGLNKPLSNDGSVCPFTSREKEILQLLFEENTSCEIGEKLYLSKRTVEEHRKNIQQKVGAKNIVGIIKYAIKNRFVQLQ